MIDQAHAAIGLPFTGPALTPDPVNGTLHGMRQGVLGAPEEAAMQPRPRATPPVDASKPLPHRVHASAYQRQQATATKPADEQYRPTRTFTSATPRR